MSRHGEIRYVKGKRVASPEYRSWQMMKNRCHNPKCESYAGYGGAGIAVCDAWESFDLFLQDMGRRPSLRHTLERIDARDHYAPHNCTWADKAQQSRNRPGFVKLTMAHAKKIRELYASGEPTHGELATMFAVSKTTIGKVCRGETWVYE